MRALMIGLIFALVAGTAQAQSRNGYGHGSGGHGYGHGGYGTGSNPNSHYNNGYYRNNGTYVDPYRSTNPNSTQRDNYSATGNVNPYTGAVGHRTPRY